MFYCLMDLCWGGKQVMSLVILTPYLLNQNVATNLGCFNSFSRYNEFVAITWDFGF